MVVQPWVYRKHGSEHVREHRWVMVVPWQQQHRLPLCCEGRGDTHDTGEIVELLGSGPAKVTVISICVVTECCNYVW